MKRVLHGMSVALVDWDFELYKLVDVAVYSFHVSTSWVHEW